MLEQFMASQIILSMGFSSKIITYVLVNIMIGKKEGRKIFFLCCMLHYFAYNVVLVVVLDYYFGSELWFRLLMPTVSLVLGVSVPVIMSFVWKINFSKIMLGFVIPDSLSLIVYIPAQIFGNPVSIIIFSIIVLTLICTLFSPFLKKYRALQINHSWIVSGLIMITLINGWSTNILYTLAEEGIVPDSIYFMGQFQVVFILFFIFLESVLYKFIAKKKQAMLLRNKAQMEDYYRQVSKHIREIDETRILLGQGTKLLAAAHQEQQDSMELSPEVLNPKELQTYLSRLKSQYEALGEVFFCNDFAIDSVLRDFVISCRQKGIGTDILFHEYKRGKVAAGDAAAILSRMLDYGQRAAEPLLQSRNTRPGQASQQSAGVCISLHGASVKNQLLFSMTVTVAEPGAWDVDGKQSSGETVRTLRKIRVKKRSFNPWMRKYNGIIHVQWEGQQMQLVVGLNNGEEQDKRE